MLKRRKSSALLGDKGFTAEEELELALESDEDLNPENSQIDEEFTSEDDVIPDDRDIDAIVASLKEPGIEDKIGNDLGNGDSMSNLKGITAKLDRFANYLQSKGNISAARRLDMITNSIEKMGIH